MKRKRDEQTSGLDKRNIHITSQDIKDMRLICYMGMNLFMNNRNISLCRRIRIKLTKVLANLDKLPTERRSVR